MSGVYWFCLDVEDADLDADEKLILAVRVEDAVNDMLEYHYRHRGVSFFEIDPRN